MQNSAKMIKYHHLSWDNGNGSIYEEEIVPFCSHVIHLADRVCTMIKKDCNILSQIPLMIDQINAKVDTVFEPKATQALIQLCKEEYIWLDLTSNFPANKVNTKAFHIEELDIDGITELVLIFSHIIDLRSSFTARHSAGVAKIAEQLAKPATITVTNWAMPAKIRSA